MAGRSPIPISRPESEDFPKAESEGKVRCRDFVVNSTCEKGKTPLFKVSGRASYTPQYSYNINPEPLRFSRIPLVSPSIVPAHPPA